MNIKLQFYGRRRARPPRGISLIEVMVSLTILAIAGLGMAGGVILSLNSNTLARKRTFMTELAQARLERLAAGYHPIAIASGGLILGLNSSLSSITLNAAGSVDLTQPAGGTGWSFDNSDTASASLSDALAWPIQVDRTTATMTDDATNRAQTLNSQGYTSCANSNIVNDSSVLCREIHLEDITSIAGVPMVRAYVRIMRGGVDPSLAFVLSEDIAP